MSPNLDTENSRRARHLWLILLFLAALACQFPALPTLPVDQPSPTVLVAPSFTPSPSATPTPSPTPTPTPRPADLLQLGQDALFIGDSGSAALFFQAVLSAAPDDGTTAQALLGLGRAFLQDEAYADAIITLQELLTRFPDSLLAQDAGFFLAESSAGAGDLVTAADYYSRYLGGETTIDAYLNGWIGDSLQSAGDADSAAAAYQDAIERSSDFTQEADLREKLALVNTGQMNYEMAVAQYEAILSRAENASYRARIAYQLAQTLVLAGQTEEGYALHLQVLEDHPTNAWAYESLVVLVDAGIPVDDLTRGIVDTYAGAYGPAVTALYRYIESSPDHSGGAHYYAGLSHLRAGSPGLAESQFQILVETHPESGRWGDGWMGLAQSLSAQGDLEGAIDTYQAFVEVAPDDHRAPEALWTTAQLLEGAGDREAAAIAYEECARAFPASDYSERALLRAGLGHYQLGMTADAVESWQALVEDSSLGSYQAAGLLWTGKAHLAAGDPLSATAAFSQAVEIDPTGYYGLRAAELLVDPVADPFPLVGYMPASNVLSEQGEAEEWLAEWLALPSAEGLSELGPSLQTDPRIQRGLELWRLGRRDEAKTELEALRRDTADDPLVQYQLALLFRDIGLYRSSILAAVNLINLSPAEGTLGAPPFIARLAYPTYYDDLIVSNALGEDLPPLLLFALVRQESLYEGFATSWAYAHGLMQVIPSTGEYIAGQLGWPTGYETDDLYRPFVSIRFGTWYLARQRDYFDGRIDAALAAYNGGPGNASRWLDAALSDPDLFLETISFAETRLYLRIIRENYAIYTALYGP